MDKLASDIVGILSDLLPDRTDGIPLHEPCFKGNEKKYLVDCIDTGYVSSVGRYVDRFEEMLTDFTGAKHAVAVVNGTAALHTALLLAGVGRNDEVLAPSLTFVATANAIRYCNAVPHFVDSCESTLGVDADKLETYLSTATTMEKDSCINLQTKRVIRALVPVHIFGMPVDMDPIIALCNQYNIILVEDAAESIGSYYKGRHTGNMGLCAAMSFNGNKTVTTGGGGAILTNDSRIAKQAKHITTTAKSNNSWVFSHDRTGFNYRMPNINAALGCAQMEQMPAILDKKRELAIKYKMAFKDLKGVSVLKEPAFAKSNFWLNTLILDKPDQKRLKAILKLTNSMGIATRPAWTLMHKLPMYQNCPAMDLECVKTLGNKTINIPSSPYLIP